MSILNQLKECRFIRLGYHSKIPASGQTGHFRSDDCNYGISDPELLNHISQGGNYGVIPRGGVCVVDCDTRALWDQVPDAMKQTFIVKSGRKSGDGRHIYLKCTDAPTGVKVVFPGELGDIRTSGHNSYVVGPGSIHPDSGMPYTVESDQPVLNVSWVDLSAFIKENQGNLEQCTQKKPATQKRNPASSKGTPATQTGEVNHISGISIKYHLRPEDYLMPENPVIMGASITGTHPIHGSESGINLHIDTQKGLWHCFRHNTGGDGAMAYAVAKGIIECSDALPGCLAGPAVMHKLLNSLEADGIKPLFNPVIAGFTDRLLQRSKRAQVISND